MTAPREIRQEVLVAAPVDDVWAAWTTSAGATAVFAPAARIELRPGGPYELYFDASAPEGSRGSEGCAVIEFETPRRLVVSWNFPPHLAAIRDEKTRFEVRLEPAADDPAQTLVRVRHTGWRAGPDWDAGFAYFERAWRIVTERLATRFASGPMDWDTC